MLPVNYLPGARRDFDESFEWYADRSPIAAARFTGAIDAAVKKISGGSSILPYVDQRHQECPVKRFPFRVVFRQDDSQILIVAIAHTKRRRNFWQYRE